MTTFAEQVGSVQTGTPSPAPTPGADSPAPVTPAPTPITPDPASPVPAPAAPPIAPVIQTESAPGAPAPVVPPVVEDPAAKRVADAQRAMHAATTQAAEAQRQLDAVLAENQTLRTSLHSIFRDPALAAVPATPPVVVTPGADAARDQAAWDAYTAAPNDQAAVATIMRLTEERTLDKAADLALARLKAQQDQQENQRRLVEGHTQVKNSINAWVATQDPTIDPRIFWAMVPDAVPHTPAALRAAEQNARSDAEFQAATAASLDWQAKRALMLAREVVGKYVQGGAAAARDVSNAALTSAVVMPGGGASPNAGQPAPAGTPPKPKTFVEQILDRQVLTTA